MPSLNDHEPHVPLVPHVPHGAQCTGGAVRSGPGDQSPFEALASAFATLHLAPIRLRLEADELPEGIDGPLRIDEVASALMDEDVAFMTKDALLNTLVKRAKADRGNWLLALAGCLLPGLKNRAAPMKAAQPRLSFDIEAEMLAGLIDAVGRASLPMSRPASTLTWAAAHRAELLCEQDRMEVPADAEDSDTAMAARLANDYGSDTPHEPWGHPDLVLAKAVGEDVICEQDAELIGVTRFERVSLYDAADALGISHSAVKERRRAAEEKLVAWIRGDFLTPRPSEPGSSTRGRPRGGRAGTRELQRCRPTLSVPKEVATPTRAPGHHRASASRQSAQATNK